MTGLESRLLLSLLDRPDTRGDFRRILEALKLLHHLWHYDLWRPMCVCVGIDILLLLLSWFLLLLTPFVLYYIMIVYEQLWLCNLISFNFMNILLRTIIFKNFSCVFSIDYTAVPTAFKWNGDFTLLQIGCKRDCLLNDTSVKGNKILGRPSPLQKNIGGTPSPRD